MQKRRQTDRMAASARPSRRRCRIGPLLTAAALALACAVGVAAPQDRAEAPALTGLVLDPAGRGLQGVKVLLSNDRFVTSLAAVLTDPQGRFRIEKAPRGRFDVAAVKPGYQVRITSIDTILRDSLNLILQPLPPTSSLLKGAEAKSMNWILRVPPGDLLRDLDEPFLAGAAPPGQQPASPVPAASGDRIGGEFVHLETGAGPGQNRMGDAAGRSSRLAMSGDLGGVLEWRFQGDMSRLTDGPGPSADADRDLESRTVEMGVDLNPTAGDDVSVSLLFGRNQFRSDEQYPDPFSPATDQDRTAWGYDARWSRAIDPLSQFDLRVGYLQASLQVADPATAAAPVPAGVPVDQTRWEAGGRYRVDLDDRHRLLVGMNTRLYRGEAGGAGMNGLDRPVLLPGLGRWFGAAEALQGWDIDLYGQDLWTLSEPYQIISSLSYSRTDSDRREEIVIPKVTFRHSLDNGTVWDAGVLVAWNPGTGAVTGQTAEAGNDQAGIGYELGLSRQLPQGFHVRVTASQHPARGYADLQEGNSSYLAAPAEMGSGLFLASRRVQTRELDLQVEKRFRHAASRIGSLVGQAEGRFATGLDEYAPMVELNRGSMRYLVTRVHTVLDRTDTEFQIGYRRIFEETAYVSGIDPAASRSYSIIDLAVAQRLAFLENLSRSEWRVILAYQDVTTDSEAVSASEAVIAPGATYSRLSGGIEIRF